MESRQVNFEESLPILTGRHTHMHMLARALSRLYKTRQRHELSILIQVNEVIPRQLNL